MIYPTIEEVIEANKLALEVHRVKKGDEHELLGAKIYSKSALLLRELATKHIFASGNRRTAFLVTINFIYKNTKHILLKEDIKENLEIFKKIRYNQISEEELIKWLKKKE